jgi:hypothetical protein
LRLKPFKTYAPKSPKDRFRIRLFNKKQTKGSSMKNKILFSSILMLAGSLIAADSTPKDDVLAAAKALGNQANYSWKSTIANAGGGGGGGRGAGPGEGKTQKDGYTWLSMTRGGNTTEAVLKGDKGAAKTQDSGWQTLVELTKGDAGGGGFNPNTFLALTLQNFKTPAAQAADLAEKAKEIKKGDDAYSSDLTDDAAKALLTLGRPATGDNAVTVANPKGSVKFWIKDGQLTKYETHLQGTVSFNGNDRDVDRTTTVEIKDIGTTKVEVPADAEKKLNPQPAPAPKA